MNYKDYVEFCKAQRPDRVINHLCWDDCSVGEYLSSIGVLATNEEVAELFDLPEPSDLPPQNGRYTKQNLYYTLNHRGQGYNTSIVTYGDLVNFMEKINAD